MALFHSQTRRHMIKHGLKLYLNDIKFPKCENVTYITHNVIYLLHEIKANASYCNWF